MIALLRDLDDLAERWRREGHAERALELERRLADLPGEDHADLPEMAAPVPEGLSWYPVITGLVALVIVCFVSL